MYFCLMTKDLTEIRGTLAALFQRHKSLFKITDNGSDIEAHGTVEAMQGKKKVDGFYFASIVPKPKDVRFYFFPIYTHAKEISPLLNDELKKALKGKSCFHIKSLSEESIARLEEMTDTAVALYQQNKWLAE